MGRRSESGGVRQKRGKCQVELHVDGKRHRITTPDPFNPGKVKLWRQRLVGINQRIGAGTFVWEDEFPRYKHILEVAPEKALREKHGNYDFAADAYEKTLTEPSFAWSTIYSYKRINRSRWRRIFGERPIAGIGAAELKEVVAEQEFATVKSHNNAVMVLKCVFSHAIGMKPPLVSRADNPAAELAYLKNDIALDHRMVYDLADAERLIRELAKDWGQHWANYFEFAFFGGGMRPSEIVALLWSDYDEKAGKIHVCRVRVMGKAKNSTKNNTKRWVKLSPRGCAILERQWKLTGGLAEKHIFTHEDGTRILDRASPWRRWSKTHKHLTKKDPAFHFPAAVRGAPQLSDLAPHDRALGPVDRTPARPFGHGPAQGLCALALDR